MILKKMFPFLLFFLWMVPAAAMKRRPEADLLTNPAKQLKTVDTRSLYEIYQAGDFDAFIERLHNGGANPNEIGPDGNAILLITQLEDKFNSKQKRIVFKELKQCGANVNAQTSGMGFSLVHRAAAEGRPKWVEFYLNGGVSPNLVDGDDHTALWSTSDQETMSMLFRAGIDVAATDFKRRTALFDVATTDPEDVRQAEEIIVRDPHIVIQEDDKVIPYRQNETAYERAARRWGNPNPDLRNEETSRKIIERRVFPQMTKSIHPGPVNITTGFMRARETGNRRFNINQLQPR